MAAKDRIILALDYADRKKTLKTVKELKNYVGVFKIGFELFISYGPDIVREINKIGGKVFLDLKLCDIPNTVGKAAEVILGLDVFMFNVHASGGLAMMKKCKEAAEKSGKDPILLGVTVITSLDTSILKNEIGINRSAGEQALRLAKLTKKAGLNGVVASGQEIKAVRKACGRNFKLVIPGIRPSWIKDGDDQKRIVTPYEAVKEGADYLVIGRPITKADNPKEAARKVILEVEGGMR